MALWDEWIISEMDLISINARTFCEDWLDAIARAWATAAAAGEPTAVLVMAHVFTLRTHLGDIYINTDDLWL